jgi:hypothetical protein
MRSFFRKFESVRQFLPLFAVLVAALFIFAGFRESGKEASSFPQLVSRELPPDFQTLPHPGSSGDENGSLRVAVPGNAIPVIVSRRNSEPFLLRFFRSGNTGICWQDSVIAIPHIVSENINPSVTFVFQGFLKHSLPPRAGPALV